MQRVDLRRGRLLLTPPTDADLDRITEVCQDPEIQAWTTVPSPYSRADAEGFLRHVVEPGWATGNEPTWAVRVLADGHERDEVHPGVDPATELIAGPPEPDLTHATLHGMISLADRGAGAWELGYWLGPDARGRGHMANAVDLAMDVAERVLDAVVVQWRCQVLDGEPNWPSWRAAWRHGFRHEGTERHGAVQRGRRLDQWTGTWIPGDPRRPVQPWTGPGRPTALPDGTETAARPAFPDPRDPDALVRQFHATYHLPVADDAPGVDRDRVHMRMGLIAEEFAELVGAVYGAAGEQRVLDAYAQAVAADDHTRDTVETADALGDLIYVIYGMALECGIPLPEVLAEVQASNLSKLGADGRPIYRADGKVLKGPGFREPDIAAVLDKAAASRRPPGA